MKLNTEMRVNRITNEVWEIPTTEKSGMLVPARIYATPAILESMDVGVFEQEIPQDRRKKIDAEVRGHGNAEQAGRCGLHRRDKGIRFARVVQHTARPVVIGQSDLGRGHAAGRPVEKPRTEPRLERTHVFRDGGLGNPHLLGSVGEPPLVHYRGERFHFCQSVHCAPV